MKVLTKYFSVIITAGVITLFFWYLASTPELFQTLFNVPLWIIIMLVILNIVRLHNNGSFLRYTLELYNKHIKVKESFYVALLTAIGNFFGPFMGGAGIRAIYLKKKHKLPYADFVATISGFYFITFIVNSAIGLIALAIIHWQTGFSSLLVYAVYLGWLILSVILAQVRGINSIPLLTKKQLTVLKKPLELINKSIKGWRRIKGENKLFYRLNRITVYGFIILYIITYLEFVAIGASPSFAAIALYVTLSTLSLLVSITPNAIGIREAIFIFASELIGLDMQQILIIAVIDRAVTFVVLFLGYVAFNYQKLYGSRHPRLIN